MLSDRAAAENWNAWLDDLPLDAGFAETGERLQDFISGLVAAREAAERERDALREAREDELRAAYVQGAMDVHENWEPSRAPDFTEAAYDYVAALKETPK